MNELLIGLVKLSKNTGITALIRMVYLCLFAEGGFYNLLKLG